VNLTDLLTDRRDREAEFFERPFEYGARIKQHLQADLPNCRVFVFGSAVEGRATAGSDIDVLIYSPDMPEPQSDRARLAASLSDLLGRVHPFEFHFVDDQGLEWYRRMANLREVGS